MQPTHSLSALFAGLLAACGGETTTATNTSNDSWDSSCPDNEYEQEYEVLRSQVETVVDADGTVPPEECYSLCTNQGAWGDIIGCELLDEVMPVVTSGSDPMTSGEPTGPGDDSSSGDGDGTGGTGGGETTGGAGTVGNETTDGATMGTSGMEDTVTLSCTFIEYCLGGRGHQALRSRPDARGNDALGRWLAATAHSEAASVVAFLALGDELAAHGAPEALVQRTREAAMDEVAHARAMTRMAQDRGARVKTPRFGPMSVRDLETIATENAIEGCVRETWAALEAAHQARAAADPELRATMTRIAADETRHAELSHDLDAWMKTRLSVEARARVEAARRRAARELLEGMQGERDPRLCALAGLPEGSTARALCQGLAARLWN